MKDERTFPIGTSCESDGRTIGSAEFSLLHTLLGARASVHTNHEEMRGSPLGGPILSGGALVALLTSSWVGSQLEVRTLAEAGLTGQGMVEVDIRFLKPIVLGDTLYFRHELGSATPSKTRQGRYTLVINSSVRTDRFDRVAEGRFTILAAERSAETA